MKSLAARLAAALGAAVLATAAGADTFVYVHDYGELNQVHGFHLGRQGLEPLPGSPFVGPDGPTTVLDQCNGYCQTMTWLREEKLLLTSGPGGLTPWRADDDGTLTPVPGAPFGPGPGLYFGVAAAAQGRDRFAWTADFGADALHGFRVEDDGTLTPLGGAPVATGAGPLGLQSRRGVLTVLHSLENAVASYAIERDGSLTAAPSSPQAFGASEAFTLDMDGAGRNVYVGDRALGQAFFFKIVNRGGELEARDANPVAMGLQNVGLGFALTKGRFVYALSTTGQAQAFRRRRGELHPLGNPVPLGLTAFAHALTPDRRAFAAASNAELRLFRVGAKGDLETAASATLAAENVNAVLFVRR
jgi:hypothetical protein